MNLNKTNRIPKTTQNNSIKAKPKARAKCPLPFGILVLKNIKIVSMVDFIGLCDKTLYNKQEKEICTKNRISTPWKRLKNLKIP
jgi:hypothetical protein